MGSVKPMWTTEVNRFRSCDDGTHMGIFWNDGSFVNGVCSEKDGSYDIEYKGLSRSDALSWVKDICGS